MNNKFIWTLAVLLAVGSMGVYGAGIESLPPLNGPSSSNGSSSMPSQSSGSVNLNLNTKTVYYPNATTKSIAAKYKVGNYSGCMQECY